MQDSLAAPITAPDSSSIEPPNPGTTSNQTPANSDGPQLCASAAGTAASAAAGQPDNQPQNLVLNDGTAAGNITDFSHTCVDSIVSR